MSVHQSVFRFSILLTVLLAFLLVDAHRAEAQYFSFGQNRVQYKDFDWRYIQSEHFDVYYYTTQNYDLAVFSALALEASLEQLQEDFGHQIADRIEVIIYDSHNDFSETNVVALPTSAEGIGGVTDAYKNRVTMPFDGDYEKFRAVLQHELVHAVINDMFYGGNVQSRLSGNALEIPLWFNEGLAEYEASGYDTDTGLYIRDGIVNDYLPPIPYLRGFLAYRGGQSVWNYIVEEYGRNKITEIMQTLKSQRNLEATFQRTLGLSIKELNSNWKDYYERIYAPAVADYDKIGNIGRLLTEDGYNTSPTFSPQGDKLALITSQRNGILDVIVINAITGDKIKTLIKGNESINFEEFNILKPNLSWSPDGTKITLSAKSEGKDQLAIIDYNTGEKQFIAFPNLDAIGSVAWSPDGKKIAFDGNIGPFQDIFVYDMESQTLQNITNDVITDVEPSWGADSETIYFTSYRGNTLDLNQQKSNVALLGTNDMYTSDIYSVRLGDNRAQRLTQTPLWNDHQPETTRNGRLVFISDANGISNVYELNVEDRTTTPITNLLSGAQQISISADGSRLAISSLSEGIVNIFSINAPFSNNVQAPIKDNDWAKRRETESFEQRVPAIGYVKTLVRNRQFVGPVDANDGPYLSSPAPADSGFTAVRDTIGAPADTTRDAEADQEADSTESDDQDASNIDFRNYTFNDDVEEDTVFTNRYLDEDVFDIQNNTTQDGRYIPSEYRLRFSTDLIYAGGGFSTFSGVNGLTQIQFSDLLGDHRISFGSNLVFDLRNSDYFIQYGNFKDRINWLFSLSHTAYNFQTFSGQALRYRYFTGSVTAQYPINRFERLEFIMSGVNIAQDISFFGADSTNNQSQAFAYPQMVYTNDRSIPGFITQQGGYRYSIGISGSPPISEGTLQFGSVLGDFRKYFDLGPRYSFALRGSAGASFGRDSQTYFLGGVQGWINRQFAANIDPFDQFSDSFLSPPAIPMRGHEFFAITGDKFSLFNAEFRFPLFAAILPGPIPILPLYNLTGVAFVDAGMAWGEDVNYFLPRTNRDTSAPYFTNEGALDFRIRQEGTTLVNGQELPAPDGDILIGSGFGLRTIVFGLPLRYDVGWPYYRDGFDGSPVHYLSIGIDF